MGNVSIESGVIGALILVFTALISHCLFKKLHFPYTIGLVASGIIVKLVFNSFEALGNPPFDISHDLILYVLLPVLIFETSINIDAKLLLKNIKPILILAAPGLILATFITGFMMGYLTPLTMGGAFLFGALISATDPVAVTAMFKILGAPERLNILVEGESLLNDATAIVMYQSVLAVVVSGMALNLQTFAKEGVSFIVIFVGGFVVGAVFSYIFLRLGKYLEHSPILFAALSMFVAYGSYITADHFFKLSGVMASLGAGIVASLYARPLLDKKTSDFLTRFWEFKAFMANSFVFLIVGVFGMDLLKVIDNHWNLLKYIMFAIIAITVARLILIYVVLPLTTGKKEEKIEHPYRHVLFWGGLRGAVALALSLSLPDKLPNKPLIICITIGVVLFTLFIQGTTIKRLLDYMGISKKEVPQVKE